MAARAAARWKPDPEVDRWRREDAAFWRQTEKTGRAWRAGMTLGEAVELLRSEPVVCACVGGPHCCRFSWDQARALQRAAHIAARMVSDVMRRIDA